MSTPKKDPEAIRAKVLADPNTAIIAESLGIDVEEYAEQVVHFVMNPNQEPVIAVMSDEKLKTLGHNPPDGHFLMSQIAGTAATVGERSNFSAAQKPKVALEQVRVGEGVDTSGADPKLKADLAEELRRNRSKKG